VAPAWERAVHALRGRKNVIDIRNIGLVGAVELEPREGKPGARAWDVFLDCFKRGVLVRQTGDIIALTPPLIIEPAQMQDIVGVLGEAIDAVA
jgi:beta-alanine--pyruvate transaminase